MPLVRRIPKFGFTNPFRVDYTVINLKTLAHLEDVAEVTPQVLVDAGLIKKKRQRVKILGLGELTRPMGCAKSMSMSMVQDQAGNPPSDRCKVPA